MIPVILLSDGYLGSGSEPWLLPDIDALPPIKNRKVTSSNGEFYPFDFIDQEAMARGWAVPGTPALEHRIGGLEKASRTGNVSGDYDNHQQMVDRRAQKVAVVARNIPLATIHGDDSSKLLVLGWGSTYGAIRAAVDSARAQGYPVSQLHLRHLNPFPSNLGELLLRFPKIMVPEINSGQLTRTIRAEFLVDANVLSKVSGKPFFPSEIEERIIQILGEK